jgi:hypothetical protein
MNKSKKKFRCLILVLASNNNGIYKNARKVWQAYGNIDSEIRTYMVYGNADNKIDNLNEFDLVYDDIEESHNPGMLKKTIRAMEYIDATYEYDFFIRTNISTFWDFSILKRNLYNLPTSECYSGDGPLTPSGYDSENGYYLSGTDTIITPESVKAIIKNKKTLDYKIPEDAAMGIFFNGVLKCPFIKSQIFFMEKFNLRNNILDLFEKLKIMASIWYARKIQKDHYRVKTLTSNREITDMYIYKQLLKYVYQINGIA